MADFDRFSWRVVIARTLRPPHHPSDTRSTASRRRGSVCERRSFTAPSLVVIGPSLLHRFRSSFPRAAKKTFTARVQSLKLRCWPKKICPRSSVLPGDRIHLQSCRHLTIPLLRRLLPPPVNQRRSYLSTTRRSPLARRCRS